MKKNISINISGIIFHIEEDGYEKLKNYLESITSYFSSFDESGEIVADIESRIAEIFLSKLNEGKQVITAEDVDSLIATMGSIQDFQAVEDEVIEEEEVAAAEPAQSGDRQESTSTEGPRKLQRDNRRKLLGGVCSGIAHYFSIDPLWIRLLFILLATDIFLSHSLGFLIVITYIVLWAVLPVSDSLEDDQKIKKMYRNPDDRVLGGVASGVAAYFGADATIIRLLFVLSIFLGGTGLIVYLILWIILPEASSITEKVQMKGEPVTLENIESNIKKSLNVDKEDEESTIVKVLLFPFRLIATVFTGIGKALGPLLLFLVEVVRILFGLLLTVIGLVAIFGLLIALGVVMGLWAADGGYIQFHDVPLQLFREIVPAWGVVASFFASVIPALAITLLGLSIIAKTKVINAMVGWTMFGIWMLSVIGLSFAIPRVALNFRAEANYEETETFDLDVDQFHLTLNETGSDEFDLAELRLEGYDGDEVKLVKKFTSYGRNRKEAIENAKDALYSVEVSDSTLLFDSNLSFAEDAKFRFQELDMILYVPYGQKFTMNYDMRYLLRYYTLSRHGYYYSQLEDNVWSFNPSGLECISCYDEDERSRERFESSRRSYEESFKIYGYYEELDFEDFTDINISGAFEIQVIENDEYKIILNGDKEKIGEINASLEENELTISNGDDELNYRRYDMPKIIISMPELRSLELDGSSKAYVTGFEERRTTLDFSGASEAEVDIDSDELIVNLSGASKLKLAGKGREMNVKLAAASILDAYDYPVDDCSIEASVASSAKVYVMDNLDIDASIASDIKYRGGARVTTNRSRRD